MPATKQLPEKKAAKSTSKAAAVGQAHSLKRAPAKKASARSGKKSTSSMNPTSNIAPPGQADAIRAWAKTQGMEVKQAGRLPAAVIQAYQESPHHK